MLFAIAASATPGPNSAMVAASSAAHGIRATGPHVAGITSGFALMVALVGLGMAGPLAASPSIYGVLRWGVLRWVGAAWMLWIAFGIGRSAVLPDALPRPPLSFGAAALFQWINPKAWVLAVATAATYTSPAQPLAPQVLLLAGLFGVAGVPCTLLWCLIGAGAARVLRTPRHLRVFNRAMAGLLAASVLPLVLA